MEKAFYLEAYEMRCELLRESLISHIFFKCVFIIALLCTQIDLTKRFRFIAFLLLMLFSRNELANQFFQKNLNTTLARNN